MTRRSPIGRYRSGGLGSLAGGALLLASCAEPDATAQLSPQLEGDEQAVQEASAPATEHPAQRLARIEVRIDRELTDVVGLVPPAAVRSQARPARPPKARAPSADASTTTGHLGSEGRDEGSSTGDATTGGTIAGSGGNPGQAPENALVPPATRPAPALPLRAAQPQLRAFSVERPRELGHAFGQEVDHESGERLHARAHFVHSTGVSEDFLRAYAELPEFTWRRTDWGRCIASQTQRALDAPKAEAEPAITSVDAGDLHLLLDGHSYDVPLTLLPDLFPYASGVAYELRERVPEIQALARRDARGPIRRHRRGQQANAAPSFRLLVEGERGFEGADAVAGFEISGALPRPLELRATLSQGQLELDWRDLWPSKQVVTRFRPHAPLQRATGSGDPSMTGQGSAIVVRLHGLSAGEWSGLGISCVFRDQASSAPTPSWRSIDFDLQGLQKVGLAADHDALWLQVTRQRLHLLNDPEFGPVEVLVERSVTTEIDADND